MTEALRKKVLRIETREKNGKKWKCLVCEGKEPGTTKEYHIFPDRCKGAEKFTGPGEYMVRMVKSDDGYWNIVECIGGPVSPSSAEGRPVSLVVPAATAGPSSLDLAVRIVGDMLRSGCWKARSVGEAVDEVVLTARTLHSVDVTKAPGPTSTAGNGLPGIDNSEGA